MNTGKKSRIAGAFQARRLQLQNRQKRHDALRAAIALADEQHIFSEVSVDGFKLILTDNTAFAKPYGYGFWCLAATKSWGIRIAQVSMKTAPCASFWFSRSGWSELFTQMPKVLAYIHEFSELDDEERMEY